MMQASSRRDRRARRGWLGAVLVLAMLVGLLAATVPAATAATPTTCPPDVTNATVPGPLVVPANQTCSLFNVTVNGPVVVQHGATLTSINSTIKGSLVGDGAQVKVCGGQITGSVSITRTPDTGDSYLSGHPFPGFCDPLTIGGPVTVANNPAQTLEVVGAVITGSLSLSSNHTRAIQLYASNTVGGSMTATNNHTDFQAVFVAFNTVTGVLACLNNSPFQSGQNTAGRFVGQCAP